MLVAEGHPLLGQGPKTREFYGPDRSAVGQSILSFSAFRPAQIKHQKRDLNFFTAQEPSPSFMVAQSMVSPSVLTLTRP